MQHIDHIRSLHQPVPDHPSSSPCWTPKDIAHQPLDSWTRVYPYFHQARPWGRARLPPRQFTEEIGTSNLHHHPRLGKDRPFCLTTSPLDDHPSHPPWANFAKIRVRLASSRPRNHNNQPRPRLILSCRTILDLSVESRGGGGRVHSRGVMR